MNTRRLILRSLIHYWRTGVVVAFGIGIAAAVIVGSLVIGDSVNGSIRDTALARLGRIDYVLATPHFFRKALADDLVHSRNLAENIEQISPVVIARGSAANTMTDATIPSAGVIGIDDSFWKLWPLARLKLSQRQAAINESLARDLALKIGDSLLVNIDKQSAIPSGTLFEHRKREDALSSMRLEVAAILPDDGVGGFRLSAGTDTPRNVFISREWLLKEIGKANVANALLVQSSPGAGDIQPKLKSALIDTCTLPDYGLKLVKNPKTNSLSLQSEGMLLSDSQANTARQAAKDCGVISALTSVYLATTIAKKGAERGMGIPYSIVAASEGVESGKWRVEGGREVWLNSWAADDIEAKIGDKIELTYLVSADDGTYKDASMTLTLAGIIDISDQANDRDLVPVFEGITTAESIGDWKAPFPVDMDRIRPKDEAYWNKYKTTPKAFVSLDTARELWKNGSSNGSDVGWITSIRLQSNTSEEAFAKAFLSKTKPEDAGMVFAPIRETTLAASSGTTDFGQLFLGMSFFLVLAGAGLAGTLMRLSADRRASETGIMMACGFDSKRAGRIVMGEGMCLTAFGVLIGVPLGVFYAWGIIAALRTLWIGAVGTSSLWLHVTPTSVLIGAISGMVVGAAAITWGIKGLNKSRVLDLLAGWQAMGVLPEARSRNRALLTLVISLAASALLLALSTIFKTIPPTGAFFGCGALLLIAGIAAASLTLARALSGKFRPISISMLAIRSAAANPGRSLLVIGLIASASFMIVAVAANTKDFTHADYADKSSGTGGFALRAISSIPIHFDFGTPAGRAALGFPTEDEAIFKDVRVYRFLMSSGDDISCLNLAKATRPRVLGVSHEFTQRGGFSIATNHKGDPWQMLESTDGAVFGDADSVEWSLHSGLGKDINLKGESPDSVRARFMGLVKGSIFASELLMSERQFKQLYPSVGAPRYFLIEAPKGMENKVEESLRTNLGEMGLEVRSTRELLNSYMSVQNTYLQVFLALGGLGLLLGTVGLVAVIMRSALERKREFALMLAAGYTKAHISRLLILENASLLVFGLICGTISALVAVAPHAASAQSKVSWGIIFALLGAIAAVGLVCCAVAARYVVNGALVQALREE